MKMKKLTNWRVDELASPMYARVMAECEKGSAYIVCVMCGGIKDDPKGTKRANQIVKAVNSHDALVEALKSIKLDCETYTYNSSNDMTETDLYNYAVEALKLAEGSTK